MLKKIIVGAAATLMLALPTLAQEISPFTARLAYAHSDKLYVVNPGGDTPIVIDETPTYAYYAVWSRDATKLAYLTSADGQTFSDMKTLKVWDGTQSTEIVSNFKAPAGVPINWTRDGKLLYFVGNDNFIEGVGFNFEAYTVDPVAGAVPELVSNQVPFDLGCGGGSPIPMDWAAWEETELGRSRPIVQLTDYGLIYPSFCAGSRTALFRSFSNELTPFAGGMLQRPALSLDERSVAGITTAETGEESLVVVNLETLEERTVTTAHPVSQLAWGADGSLYYSSVTESANMLEGLTEEQLSMFSTAIGMMPDMPETKMPHNTVSVYRIAPDGTESTVFEALDAHEIGRMQVVGGTLYFSIVTNGDEWVKAILDGTITQENSFETADDYIHTNLYAVDLATPGSTPGLVMEDASQFTAAGQ